MNSVHFEEYTEKQQIPTYRSFGNDWLIGIAKPFPAFSAPLPLARLGLCPGIQDFELYSMVLRGR